ncbi:tail fiber assembly protein [Escherichia coli]|uniref:tail fiber assembly protein n=1 Tax=Escherichia coli TaxID=562 RepID=UPI000944DB8C|nr:tail fiber assembly protein [Escherichia coli]EFF9654596.1 tail fiber assembly protein [Escherichia coli]OKV10315.1 phage tail protein [Escherichia coli]OKV96562.1 phage tail protein [Escherichia coli]
MDKKIYFSAKENTFFFESMKSEYEKAGYWPDDLCVVTHETYQIYAGGNPPEGKKRGQDSSGQPVWVDISAPTNEQYIAFAEQQRKELLEVANTEIAWRQYAVNKGIATKDESLKLEEWNLYRVLLMRVDASKAPGIEWPVLP